MEQPTIHLVTTIIVQMELQTSLHVMFVLMDKYLQMDIANSQ
jgi:hypothetical protein